MHSVFQGHVYKQPPTVNDAFTRDLNKTDKSCSASMATIFKKMQDENFSVIKSSFRFHLMPSDDTSVLTQSGGGIQPDTCLHHPPVKC